MTGRNWAAGALGVLGIGALATGVFLTRDLQPEPAGTADVAALPAPQTGNDSTVVDVVSLPPETQSAVGQSITALERDVLQVEIRRYLLENPEIIVELIDLLEVRRAADAVQAERQMLVALDDQLYSDGYSFVGGNPDGDVTLIEFLDYQCSFCKRAHTEIEALLAADGNIRLVVKEFPILGPVSESASRATLAVLRDQGPELYYVFSDQMMSFPGRLDDTMIDRIAERSGVDVAAMRGAMDDREITRQIEQNRALAERLQITGTPTFVLGDKLIRGYLPAEEMAEAVRLTRNTMR